jgi:hypothetical protein
MDGESNDDSWIAREGRRSKMSNCCAKRREAKYSLIVDV